MFDAIKNSGRKRIPTEFGTVHLQGDYYRVTGNDSQLYDWAHRPGSWWPCSTLVQAGRASAVFDSRDDLVDFAPLDADVAGDELSAWASDVLAEAVGIVS